MEPERVGSGLGVVTSGRGASVPGGSHQRGTTGGTAPRSLGGAGPAMRRARRWPRSVPPTVPPRQERGRGEASGWGGTVVGKKTMRTGEMKRLETERRDSQFETVTLRSGPSMTETRTAVARTHIRWGSSGQKIHVPTNKKNTWVSYSISVLLWPR